LIKFVFGKIPVGKIIVRSLSQKEFSKLDQRASRTIATKPDLILLFLSSPSVVSEATAEEKLVASSESARSLLIQRLEGSRPAVRSGAGGYGFSMGSIGGMR